MCSTYCSGFSAGLRGLVLGFSRSVLLTDSAFLLSSPCCHQLSQGELQERHGRSRWRAQSPEGLLCRKPESTGESHWSPSQWLCCHFTVLRWMSLSGQSHGVGGPCSHPPGTCCHVEISVLSVHMVTCQRRQSSSLHGFCLTAVNPCLWR